MRPAPAPLPESAVADALATLEFPQVLDVVAGFAAGPMGAARVRARRPSADLSAIRRELAEVGEVAALFRRGDELRAEPVPDVTDALARLKVEGAVLEPLELAGIRRLLGAVRAIDSELRRVAELCPLTADLRVELPPRQLDARLAQAVDDDGNILDSASPALAAARRNVQTARQRLIRALESILHGLDAQTTSADATVTVRNGRYVIPVRRDSRKRPPGIVHDESASAATLFVEPQAVIEHGNALREAQVEEEREILRVLRRLSESLRPEQPALLEAFEAAIAVDDLVARARYAAVVQGEVPGVDTAPAALALVDARHPLLLAAGGAVVPFDLLLEADERTLVISGPNTGGKTVLLKATALAALLAQSGIVPPVGPGSQLPIFRRVFADIGDRQSIAASLSTFSAHVALLRRVLDEADGETLVLLDEVGSGTDPAEGAALAAASLSVLTRRGAVTLATTHLGALKSLATEVPGVVNGSLQFDGDSLSPTYQFRKGVPGRSYGLAIARRLGVVPTVLQDAEGRVSERERELDALLARAEARDRELTQRNQEVEMLQLELAGRAAGLELQRAGQEAREKELRAREKDADQRARREARRYLLEAREEVEAALQVARDSADEAKAKEARRLIESAADALRDDDAHTEAGRLAARPPDRLTVGQKLKLPSGLTGDVLEIRDDGKVVLAVGSMRLVADPSGAEILPSRPGRSGRAPAGSGRATSDDRSGAVATEAAFEIDLRGMTGDEAETTTVAALDAAVLSEQPYLRIIHGMGTGVVRDRVREVLKRDRRVVRFDFAPRNQGGVGVTIAEFTA